MLDLLPAPPTMGLPEKFNRWRRGQAEAVVKAMDSDKRFVVLGMPTGFGKSLVYMACGTLGDPTVILTSTKGLQSQLITDFSPSGLHDIRGLSNYTCKEMNDDDGPGIGTIGIKPATQVRNSRNNRYVACDEGPCLTGWDCGYSKVGCNYFDAQRAARASHITVTNYAYWMAVNAKSRDTEHPGIALGNRGRLVLDEAHAAVDELGDHLAIEIGHWEVEGVLGAGFPDRGQALAEWRDWARTLANKAGGELEELKQGIKDGYIDRRKMSRVKELSSLTDRLSAVASVRGEWLHEESRDRRGRRVVRFDPVWPGEYAEQALFCSVPKVILTSATIRPKTLELLGIPKEEYEFIEYPSAFPVARRPVIWVPTIRVRHDTDPGSMRVWAAKIERIIEARSDRKGLVHTVSYSRRDYLLRCLGRDVARRVVTHDSGGLSDAVEHFKRLPDESGAVFISPSVSTGFDFPGPECRYQIIAKVPFPDSRSKVLQARQERDKEFFAYVAAQTIVQMAGRGMRSETDWCETIVVDDNVSWFLQRYRKFVPKWFLQAYRRSESLPEPLAY